MKTPIRLISISLRNFLSYGNDITTVNLEFGNPTLIIGRNFDSTTEGEVDSNGAGKTTIVNALAWCLYDEPISDIPQDALINFINKKNLEVTVIFEKDNTFYKVVRFRKHKAFGGDGIFIFKSDKDDFTDHATDKDKDIAHSSIAQSNKQLVQIIDMPFEIFSRIVIYSAGSPSFFKLPTTSKSEPNQTDIMEELTGLTDLSKKADLLNERMKTNKKEIESLKRIQDEIDNQKSQYESKINAIKTRIKHWDDIRNTDIENLSAKIQELSKIDYEFQQECLVEFAKIDSDMRTIKSDISLNKVKKDNLEKTLTAASKWIEDYQAKLITLNKRIADYEEVDYAEQEKMLSIYEDNITSLKLHNTTRAELTAQIVANNTQSAKNAKEIEHLRGNTCPYCLQQFKDVAAKLDELEKANIEFQDSTTVIEAKLSEIKTTISATEDCLTVLESEMKFKTVNALNEHKNKLTTLTNELSMVESQTNPYADVDVTDMEAQIEKLNGELDKLDQDLIKLSNNHTLLKKHLIFSSEAELLQNKHKLETYKTDLAKLETSTNPHAETLLDMSDMQFDDNNYKKIEELENIVLHQMLLHKLLTKKDSFVRKSLLSKSLVFLNEQLKKYLDRLGLPHKVTFTEDMTASISQFGNTLRFGNLSSGQQARVNIALAFSFRDVLQKRYGKISFCILDECLDTGLSTAGVQKAAKFIKSVATSENLSMFIISHKDEVINTFPNVMEIELEGGFSRILPSKIVQVKNAA